VPFALANSLDGMVGAFVARGYSTPGVRGLRIVLLFIASIAIGSAAGAVVGPSPRLTC